MRIAMEPSAADLRESRHESSRMAPKAQTRHAGAPASHHHLGHGASEGDGADHRPEPRRRPPTTLDSIIAVLTRRWRVVVITLLVCLGLMALTGALLSPTYTASTSLVVSPAGADPFGAGGEDVNIQTEREILGSSEVAQRAAEQLGVDFTPQSYLLTESEIAAPSGSQVLIVSVSAQSAQDAAEAADALATAYLEFRSEGAVEAAERHITAIDERLAESLTEDDPAAQVLAGSLFEERHRLALVGSDPGRIIGYASVPESPSSPGLIVFITAGLVGGLLLGGFLALARERLDGRVRSADRLALATGHEVITASSPAEDEAWQRVAYALHRHAGVSSHRRSLVCMVGPGIPDVDVALSRLGAAVEQAGMSVTVAQSPEEIGGAIQDGWPQAEASDVPSDVVLADLSDVGSMAQLASVLEHAQAVVIAVSPRTRLRDVSRVLSSAEMARLDAVTCVLVQGRQHLRAEEPRAEHRQEV